MSKWQNEVASTLSHVKHSCDHARPLHWLLNIAKILPKCTRSIASELDGRSRSDKNFVGQRYMFDAKKHGLHTFQDTFGSAFADALGAASEHCVSIFAKHADVLTSQKTLKALENKSVLHCKGKPSQITEPQAGVRQVARWNSPNVLRI